MNNNIAVIGGGPAGLMTAEVLASAGFSITVYDHKSSLARKFLMAGRGGLNLTHSEDLKKFISRYGAAAEFLEPIIEVFPPSALRAWCEGLGQETFTGSSGRVFPKAMKASPLLRAWLARLENLGVKFVLRHRWLGWDDAGDLLFQTADGAHAKVKAAATVLALGGASWSHLGSDGNWVNILLQQDVAVTPLQPANCGFVVQWSAIFKQRFAGQPLKPVTLSLNDITRQGELMISEKGIEGGLIYAFSAPIRETINKQAKATIRLDLTPNLSIEQLVKKFQQPRAAHSFSNYLKKYAGLSPVAIGLLNEQPNRQAISSYPPLQLAELIKALPITLTAPFAIDRAISTAGGIALDAIDNHFMLRNKSGVFVAGEMLDWEAPTGGYLLQACFATAVAAAKGVQHYLALQPAYNKLG